MNTVDLLLETTDKFASEYVSRYVEIAASLPRGSNILELGIGEGGSTQLWHILFPESKRIVGVDIDNEKVMRVQRNSAPGVTVLCCGQDDYQLLEALGRYPFDLIVDDASHDPAKTAASFGLLWEYVNPGGVYVIEDWRVHPPEHGLKMMDVILSIIEDSKRPGMKIESVSILPIGMVVIRKVRF